MNERAKLLGQEEIPKLLLKFSIPAITGMVVNALYNIVDRIYVGNGVGQDALSGLSIGFPIMNILMAFSMLVGIGGANLISLRLGENKKDEAEEILNHNFILLIGISIVITALGLIFLKDILKFFGAVKPEIYNPAYEYMQIILCGFVFQCIGFGLNHSIRAEGRPTISMMTMIIGAVINTILDPILIFVFDMGVRGAAIATIISQAVSSIWVLYTLFSKKSSVRIHISKLKLKLNIVKDILAIGSASFAIQIAASAVMTLLNRALVKYGLELGPNGDSVALAAFASINSIGMMVLMPVFGINQGTQPVVGFNYGAKNYKRVLEAYKYSVIASSAVTTLGFIIVMLFPNQIISLFISEEGQILQSFGSMALKISFCFYPVVGAQILSGSYFQMAGKPKLALFLTTSRQVILLIPMIIILPKFLGIWGAVWATPIADILAAIITIGLMFREIKFLRSHIID